jgi:hypothetical protein
MVYGDYYGRETEWEVVALEGRVFMAYAQAGIIWGASNYFACG